jgi:hypothetical protein
LPSGERRLGAILRVVCLPDVETDSIFVITAYPRRPKPLRALRRRRRRR